MPPAIQTAQELNKTLFYKQAVGGNLQKWKINHC